MADITIQKLYPGTWAIDEGGVRFFLLCGDSSALLIDSGMTVHNALDIARSLTDLPVRLLNTHADPDHIGSNAQFAEFYMNPAEATNYYSKPGAAGRILPVEDKDTLDLGGRPLRIIALAGHTPGSIAVLDENSRALFSGDPIQNGSIYLFGPHRELHAYLLSLQKAQHLSHLFDTVYPSHAACPVSKDIIPALIAGTEKVLSGEIKGEDALQFGAPIRRCDIGAATLLCDR